jgi:ATP-dependent Lhr-like helicase
VGELDEEFLEGLVPGDVFTLGGHTWQFNRASGMKAYVAPAEGRRPTVPQWSSEQLPLAGDLAREVRRFRAELARLLPEGAEKPTAFLRDVYNVDGLTSEAILGYFKEQARFGGIPEEREILVEEFVDDDLRRNYVFHALRGRRTNEALARAFARAVGEWKGANVRVQVNDNGFVLVVPRACVLTAGEVKSLFLLDLPGLLQRALEGSEILKRRFRHVATRALLILRNYAGRSPGVGRRQVNAFILFHVLRRLDPGFPVIREVYREISEEAFDVADAEALCRDVRDRRAKVRVERKLKAPSPFAHNLVALSRGDSVLLDDRKRLVRDLHERVRDLLAEREAP